MLKNHRSPRIGLFCDLVRRSGVLRYTAELAARLTAEGCDVGILALAADSPSAAENLADLRTAAPDVQCLPQTAGDLERVAQLREAIAQGHFDVFVPNYRDTTYAALAGLPASLRPRVVGVCHNDHESYYRLLTRFESIIAAFVAPTRAVAEALRVQLPARAADVSCIPHGIELPAEPCAAFGGGTIRLVYHGRLNEEQKATSSLIELSARLCERGVDHELHLIGDADAGVDYAQLARENARGGSVRLQPSLPPPALAAELRRGHVAVLSSRYEGFCLGLAEAMAAGLPAVAMRCGGVIEEYLRDGENGWLVDQADVAALADGVARFAADPVLWSRMSRAARETIARQYAPQAFGRAYAALVERLTDAPARHDWPRLRPVVCDAERQPLRALVNSVGRKLGAWP